MSNAVESLTELARRARNGENQAVLIATWLKIAAGVFTPDELAQIIAIIEQELPHG